MDAFVRIENLAKTYSSGDIRINALHDVSFEVEKGEICIIAGQSGAGKTTLLNILGGMDMPTSGKVFLDGADISATKKK